MTPTPTSTGTICKECGRELGAGYLCDGCDQLEVLDQ